MLSSSCHLTSWTKSFSAAYLRQHVNTTRGGQITQQVSRAKYWLDAGLRASPSFKNGFVAFTNDAALETSEKAASVVDESTQQELTEYVESSLSLERDLEDQIVSHLDMLEPGLTLVSRQESSEVGRLDLLARDSEGRTVKHNSLIERREPGSLVFLLPT